MENQVLMELPTRLHQQIRLLVKEGWYRDETDILLERNYRAPPKRLSRKEKKLVMGDRPISCL